MLNDGLAASADRLPDTASNCHLSGVRQDSLQPMPSQEKCMSRMLSVPLPRLLPHTANPRKGIPYSLPATYTSSVAGPSWPRTEEMLLPATQHAYACRPLAGPRPNPCQLPWQPSVARRKQGANCQQCIFKLLPSSSSFRRLPTACAAVHEGGAAEHCTQHSMCGVSPRAASGQRKLRSIRARKTPAHTTPPHATSAAIAGLASPAKLSPWPTPQ